MSCPEFVENVLVACQDPPSVGLGPNNTEGSNLLMVFESNPEGELSRLEDAGIAIVRVVHDKVRYRVYGYHESCGVPRGVRGREMAA